MRLYSPFFQTLHDESGPTGYLGRGTHCSVLRATVFHDAEGKPLPEALVHDFAIIWDEDHDERVMPVVEAVYRAGMLPALAFIGERKGMLSAITAGRISASRLAQLRQVVSRITDAGLNGDPWSAEVSAEAEESGIINGNTEQVLVYLANLRMLWALGSKPAPLPDVGDFEEAMPVVVHGFKKWNQAAGAFDIAPTKRTAEEIARLKGEIIEGTAETVPQARLDAFGRYDARG